jgi:hypothetical protein
MNILKTLLASSIALAILGTAGCSDGENQDTQQEDATSFTGLVVDGRVARGFVWVDVNDNGAIDTFEPYAYTDADGYYGYNPLTHTNYCEDTNHQYCLSTGMVEGDFTIRIAGGVDLGTGEPFEGVMTLNANLDDAKEVEQQVAEMSGSDTSKPDFIPVISPLTSLTGNGSVTEKAELLTNLGIEGVDETNVEALLAMDFTDFSTDEPVAVSNRKSGKSDPLEGYKKWTSLLLEYAVVQQKTVDVISFLIRARLTALGYDLTTLRIGIGDQFGWRVTYGAYYEVEPLIISRTIAIIYSDKRKSLNADGMRFILEAVMEYIEDSPPVDEKGISDITKVVNDVQEGIEDAFDGVENEQDAQTGQIGAGVIGATVKEQAGNIVSDDPEVSNTAQDTLKDTTDAVNSDEFRDKIADTLENNQTVDVKQLSDNLSNGESVADSVANATLAEAPEAGEAGIWAQRVLSMSGKSEDGERGRVMFFFGGEQESDTEGDVSICYAYNANNNDDDITAVLLTGTWQELNARGIVQINNGLVSFTVKALKQAPIPETEYGSFLGLGDTSVSPDSTTNYGHLRFVNDGKQEVWFSDITVKDTTDTRDFGLVEAASIPTTPAQCESYVVNGVENALSKNLGF